MKQASPNPYLRTRVMTASPEQLRLMLYDGALRFTRQGREAIDRGDYETSYNAIARAKRIVLELSNSLNRDAHPDLCQRLAALYTYIYRRLMDVNMSRDVAALDEAIELIGYERETWQMYMDKLQSDGGGNAGVDGGEATPGTLSRSA
ncbi:MAG: flagellar export chaperone FliS [Phycisphaeraceae bacterium]